MAEHPILFSEAMVQAILAGRKTQTRRVIQRPARVQPLAFDEALTKAAKAGWNGVQKRGPEDGIEWRVRCPYGQPGDTPWVRETWRPVMYRNHSEVEYRAGGMKESLDVAPWSRLKLEQGQPVKMALRFAGGSPSVNSERWHPSIHMPRWASRITLRVTEVRVERLQAITEEDARAEGATVVHDARTVDGAVAATFGGAVGLPRRVFEDLWDSINGERPGCAWADNPWVWVVSFERAGGDHG